MKGKTNDIIRFLNTLTIKKIVNSLGLLFSYYWIRISGKFLYIGRPANISIEPTTSCNLKCLECPCGLGELSRDKGNIDGKLYRKIIDESHRYLLSLTLYFQGEPFLHKFLFKMIEYAKEKKIYTLTSTNGHFLDETNAKRVVNSGLDRIIISLDGTTSEAYTSYRIGGNFEKVLEGIGNLVKQKEILRSNSPFIILQFLVHKKNEHQIEDAKKLAKQVRVNKIVFKTMQLNDKQEDRNDLLPKNPRFSRYKNKLDKDLKIKNRLPNRCFRMWQSCVVTWDGKVIPCCFDKDAKYTMGDLHEEIFQSIWRSEVYLNFKRQIFKNRKGIKICQNCTEGLKK